jgi:glycosyltransferase involved in cell wall biosynthesis
VNDGSEDEGPQVAENVAEQDPRIRVLHIPPSGIVAALQKGIDRSSGPLIARMDADDESHPERFARQVELLASHPHVDLVSCRVQFGGDREKQAGYAAHVDWLNEQMSHEEMFLHRFVDAPVAHPSVMFRRAALEKWGGYREGGFPEDFEMWLRWMERGARFAKCPEELLIWNDPPDRLSRVEARYAPAAFFRLKCEVLLRALPDHRPVWLWGAGRLTRKRFAALDMQRPFAGFIDIDPAKTGRNLRGRPVVQPEQIPDGAFILTGVASRGARERASAYLEMTGRRIGTDYLPAA